MINPIVLGQQIQLPGDRSTEHHYAPESPIWTSRQEIFRCWMYEFRVLVDDRFINRPQRVALSNEEALPNAHDNTVLEMRTIMTEQSKRRDSAASSRAPSRSRERDTKSGGTERTPKRTTIVREARQQLEELLGKETESISAFRTTDDGWQINVEVVEVARIPDTTSILATYSVQLDTHGELVGYERMARYARGQIGR